MRKSIAGVITVMCLLTLTSCDGADQNDYLLRLFSLRGTSYWTLQCSDYITTAKKFRHCGAAEFWRNGCGGALVTVAEVSSANKIPVAILRAGDVIAFHGVHVAAYVGDGKFMDSDPNHYGVGDMTPDAIHGDTWFAGKVKILRWKS